MPIEGNTAEFAAILRASLPQLVAERLALHAPVLEDFADYREILMSGRARFMQDKPPSRQGAWRDDKTAAEFDEPVLVYRHLPRGGTA
ncbi:hypothetical protein NO357_12320 [Marimonas arenosa]|uniref:Uncharacterized protein n=1 Tax=Marimonas arenosa TaxID=1795305 RepID=A0AAE3WCZ7_9RHOB|nr:hypothetical protein [Marimonas arenosa]